MGLVIPKLRQHFGLVQERCRCSCLVQVSPQACDGVHSRLWWCPLKPAVGVHSGVRWCPLKQAVSTHACGGVYSRLQCSLRLAAVPTQAYGVYSALQWCLLRTAAMSSGSNQPSGGVRSGPQWCPSYLPFGILRWCPRKPAVESRLWPRLRWCQLKPPVLRWCQPSQVAMPNETSR